MDNDDLLNTPQNDSSENRKKNISGRKKLLFIVIPSVVILLLAIFLALPLFVSSSTILPNVWIGNVDVGGMTEYEAENALLNQYIPKDTKFSVTFKHMGHTRRKSFTSKDIDLTLDPKKSSEKAYKFGHSDNPIKNSWNVLTTFFSKKNIVPVPYCNIDKLSDILYNFGVSVHGEHEDAVYKIENNTFSVTPPIPGQNPDVSDAVKKFISSITAGKFLDIPIVLTTNEQPLITIEEAYKNLYLAPTEPSYQVINNQVTITDPIPGRDADPEKLKALVEQVNTGSPAAIEIIPIMPKQTKNDFEKLLFNSTLSSFSSNYRTSSANRAYNVELAASKINGIVLAADEVFSYNKVVGNANAANGFKIATVFSNGKVTEGVGGGVCQVSSTLYCALLRTGLDIVERHNHSLPISYVPGGQDATVAYNTLDFKFKNNTGAPIKIIATCSNRTLTVSLVGNSTANRYVEVTSEKLSTIPYSITEIPDPTLPLGTRKVLTEGSPGSVYLTRRRIHSADGVFLEEQQTKSKYKAVSSEVAVGTMPY